MNKPLSLLICLLTLSACHTLPESGAPHDITEAAIIPDSAPQPAPSRNFNSEALYDLLLAELAGHREQPQLALQHYQRQLQQTQSPLVAERAFQIADYLNDHSLTQQSAQLWLQLAPNNAAAHRAAALDLAKRGQFAKALEHTGRAIALEPDNDSHFDFIAFAAGHASPATRPDLLITLEQLVQQYPERSELRMGKAILLQDSAPAEALQLLQQMPDNDKLPALALQARLYQQLEQPGQSLAVQARMLELQPANAALRLNYARQLIGMEHLEEARDQFIKLLQAEPDNDDFRLGLAYLYIDLEAWPEALVYLEELLLRGNHIEAALYNKARALEALEQPDIAISVYQSIAPGPYYLASRQQLGILWLQKGNLKQFTQSFAQARQTAPEERAALFQIEIELLGRHQQADLAWQRADLALQQLPDDPSLLYTRAMLAVKRDDLQQLETDLQRILATDPDNAMAMNALGYTLTDRTSRHTEALQLIQRAHELQPDDPATLDSLGWVYFRLGQPETALPLLQQAFAIYPDAEVAAHLGEVHWTLGNKRKARKIWREALQQEPAHEILRETVNRLDPGRRWTK